MKRNSIYHRAPRFIIANFDSWQSQFEAELSRRKDREAEEEENEEKERKQLRELGDT